MELAWAPRIGDALRIPLNARATLIMHIVDSTLFFAPHSGGVKRYLLAKRQFLGSLPGVRHSLIVPGARCGRLAPGVHTIAAPRLPFGGGYRLPLRTTAWRDALLRLEPDVIEVGDPYHVAWTAIAAAERLGVPAVAFAHSNLPRMIGDRFGAGAARAAAAYLRRLYSRFDAVLAPSRVMAESLRDIGIGNIDVQPLGVDADTFTPSARDDELRARLQLPVDTRLLIFAGRMAREKSVALMRDAVEGLGSRYHLLLVGAREQRRVSARVTELPYQLDPKQLARLLASADALLHAGAQETFGLIVVEAMACGLPVVGVASGAVAELVDPRTGVLAAAHSVAALQAAIVQVYQGDRQAMALQARARVEREFTWQRVFAAQLQRYSRLTGKLPAYEPDTVARPS